VILSSTKMGLVPEPGSPPMSATSSLPAEDSSRKCSSNTSPNVQIEDEGRADRHRVKENCTDEETDRKLLD
jgi:hypothetical protein